MMNGQDEQAASLIRHGLVLIKDNKLQEAKTLLTHLCETNPLEIEAWYLLSTVYGQTGEFTAAHKCCRRVLDSQPNHCEARVILGNILYSQGERGDALIQYRKALQINPDHALAHCNLGNLLAEAGNYEEAASSHEAAIRLNPNLFNAFLGLGNLRLIQSQYDKAVNCFKRAIQLNPMDAPSHNGFGIALTKLGNLDDAIGCFRKAIGLKADFADAYINLGNLYLNRGNQNEAIAALEQALTVAPNSAEACNDLGVVYLEKGDMEQAIHHFQRAVDIKPLFVVALNNLGIACRSPEKFSLYLELYRKTIDLLPDPEQARKTFIDIIKFISPSNFNPWLDQELIKCFSMPDANYESLALITARHLKHKYQIDFDALDDQLEIRNTIEKIASDDLFVMFLEKTFNIDADLEILLTNLRRNLLFKHCREAIADGREIRVISALAYQGLNNEYVFMMDEEERRLLSDLKSTIERRVTSGELPIGTLQSDLLVYAMYDRLYTLSCRESLSVMRSTTWSEEFRTLLEQTLITPLEEEIIKNNIERIGDIEDKTSKLVQSQYEENPYPRWLSVPDLNKRNINRVLKQMFPHFSPPAFLDGPIRILIAGCGTGQQPVQAALSYDNVEILAVDISRSSLAYAIRMAQGFGVKNIGFRQGDILQLAELDARFHIIECTGVLHHMEDPLQGWKVLCGLLVDNGLMSIGLYSEKARKHIVAARAVIQRENLTPDRDSIRNFRTRIMRHEMGDVLYQLCRCEEFFSTSSCRDLIFHFKEHRYTLQQIERELTELNLEFIGFKFIDNMRVINEYREQFPQDKDMTNLASWDQFETRHPKTFLNMYNFWCQKKAQHGIIQPATR